MDLTGSGEPEQLEASSVSASFFRVLGIARIRGRDFAVDEEQGGRTHVAVIAHGLWQRRFGGPPTSSAAASR